VHEALVRPFRSLVQADVFAVAIKMQTGRRQALSHHFFTTKLVGELLARSHKLGVGTRRLLQLGIGFQGRQAALGAGLIEQLKDFLLRGLVVVSSRAWADGGRAEENPYSAEENEQVIHTESHTGCTFPFSSPLPKYYNPAILAGGMVWAPWY
jgi:hypothetical protein